jgi:hypothetical protein
MAIHGLDEDTAKVVQQQSTRGLSGNRNAQGDFMPVTVNPEEKMPELVELGNIDNMSQEDLMGLLATLQEEHIALTSSQITPESEAQLEKVEDAIAKVEDKLNEVVES